MKPLRFKPKDMIPTPWMLAMALQADGWYLRMDIIWSKPNPMPESVTDRPTKSHEYVFLLSKQERYYFDSEAVREGSIHGRQEWTGNKYQRIREADPRDSRGITGKRGTGTNHDPSAGRNLRSVLTIPTEAYPGAHFATFPRKLVEPCIKAGTSAKGVCPECGAPWIRETSVEQEVLTGNKGRATQAVGCNNWEGVIFRTRKHVSTTGWRPTCSHGHEPIPATVLDPFAGSGTTLVVANALGRRAVGLDLSREYLGLAQRRVTRPHARVPRPGRADEVHPLFDRA